MIKQTRKDRNNPGSLRINLVSETHLESQKDIDISDHSWFGYNRTDIH